MKQWQKWTDEEDAAIRHFGQLDQHGWRLSARGGGRWQVLAQRFGRSVASVRMRASRLNVQVYTTRWPRCVKCGRAWRLRLDTRGPAATTCAEFMASTKHTRTHPSHYNREARRVAECSTC